MNEPTLPGSILSDPRDCKQAFLAAATRGPVVVDADTGVLHVLRYRDVERLLHEPRLRGVGLSMFDLMGIGDGPLRRWYGSLMFTNDGPRHDRLRRLVSKAFTPRAVEQLRPIAAAQVHDKLTAIRVDGGGDLVAALAHVPMHVMCTLIGVPLAAVLEFIAWVDALSPVFGIMEPAQIDAAEDAISSLTAYVEALVEARGRVPANDLITSLIRAEDGADRLSREETVTMVANLLVGGHDTTASQIGCTLLTLLSRPSVLATVRSDPSRLAFAVSETIRFEPSITGAPRTVVEPLEICGAERRAGTIVSCNLLAANRDPETWRDPDAFAPERFDEPGTPRLLSFGAGPHYCLGAALARTTLEESVRAVGELQPRLLEDPDRIGWVQVLGRSPGRLAVTL